MGFPHSPKGMNRLGKAEIPARGQHVSREEVVGANGFEPSTSWFRTMKLKNPSALSGVA
jgi:hypothetical protein